MGGYEMVRTSLAVALLLTLTTAAVSGPMIQRKGLSVNEGCLAPAKVATEKLTTCPVADARIRIWCPNGNVFDRDPDNVGVALLRSICEMNQLPS
jgi:hypothetical protein